MRGHPLGQLLEPVLDERTPVALVTTISPIAKTLMHIPAQASYCSVTSQTSASVTRREKYASLASRVRRGGPSVSLKHTDSSHLGHAAAPARGIIRLSVLVAAGEMFRLGVLHGDVG